MELTIDTTGGVLRASISGEGISMQEAMEFKKQLGAAVSKNNPSKISLIVKDAYTLPSAIVGALLKYKEIEKIEIELLASKRELIDSLSSLSLQEILNARPY